MAMRTILALALAAGSLGQSEQDARALLQGVGDASGDGIMGAPGRNAAPRILGKAS